MLTHADAVIPYFPRKGPPFPFSSAPLRHNRKSAKKDIRRASPKKGGAARPETRTHVSINAKSGDAPRSIRLPCTPTQGLRTSFLLLHAAVPSRYGRRGRKPPSLPRSLPHSKYRRRRRRRRRWPAQCSPGRERTGGRGGGEEEYKKRKRKRASFLKKIECGCAP